MAASGSRSDVFRKVAMERLSSPEQLDTLMRIITPQAWLALVPLLMLTVIALIWGWFGSLPTKVLADKCILINPTGLADITSGSSGRITQILVKVGDPLVEGTEIARVAQPELLDRIQKAQDRLHELEAQEKVTLSLGSQGAALADESLVQQRRVLEGQMHAARERAGHAQARGRVAQERGTMQEELFRQGLVTNSSVFVIQQEAILARQDEVAAGLEVENLKGQIEQLKLLRLDRDKQRRGESSSIAGQISEVKRQIDSLQSNLLGTATVTSRYIGRVTEVKAGMGMLVGNGTPVVTVELANQPNATLQAVIYMPLADGRKVLPAMEVQIVPSTVKREEHGYVRGNVTRVSDYPATPQSMMLLLQNEGLVRDLAGVAPPTEIRAQLKTAESLSGYQWSSARGPDVKLASGTMCKAEITIERQRPLGLVIPILKRSGRDI
jgi:HlyD family secretion protein